MFSNNDRNIKKCLELIPEHSLAVDFKKKFPQSHRKKAVFLDRDGIINFKMPEGDYVKNCNEFKIIPGAIEAICELKSAGYYIFIVTNQRGIALGLINQETLNAIHQQLINILSKKGSSVDGIFICPHDYADNCECRKPKPGLILRAASLYGFEDLNDSYMIGDSFSDIEAGKAVGCKCIYVNQNDICLKADYSCGSLMEAKNYILHNVFQR